MNLILVCLVCQCNVYVIPESIRRKDLGYKSYQPGDTANLLCGVRMSDLVQQLVAANTMKDWIFGRMIGPFGRSNGDCQGF